GFDGLDFRGAEGGAEVIQSFHDAAHLGRQGLKFELCHNGQSRGTCEVDGREPQHEADRNDDAKKISAAHHKESFLEAERNGRVTEGHRQRNEQTTLNRKSDRRRSVVSRWIRFTVQSVSNVWPNGLPPHGPERFRSSRMPDVLCAGMTNPSESNV